LKRVSLALAVAVTLTCGTGFFVGPAQMSVAYISLTSPSQQFSDGVGNTWSMSGCSVWKNGSVAGGWPNTNVVKITYVGGVIYFYNGATWYQWSGSAWSSTTDPGTGGPRITGPGQRINDVGGNIWYLDNCWVYKNGASVNYNSHAMSVVKYNVTIYVQYTSGMWSSYSDGAWPNVTNPFPAGGDGLTVKNSGQIIYDTAYSGANYGNAWTIVSGEVHENGVKVGRMTNAGMLAYLGGSIYAQDTSLAWWLWNGSAWAAVTNPYGPLPVASLIARDNQQLLDGSGNVWSIVSGVAYENGATAGTSSNVSEIAYAGSPTPTVSYLDTAGHWHHWSGSAWSSSTNPFGATVPVAGVCGRANGTTTSTAPTTNLCAAGSSASPVSATGPWYWTCTAMLQTQCSAAPPTGTGTPAAPAQASAAGYTTVIFDNEYATANLSSILSCTGTWQTKTWKQGIWWENPPGPCNQIFTTYDQVFGQNALDLEWLYANNSSTVPNRDQAISTYPLGYPNPVPSHFAYQYGYIEFVARVSHVMTGVWPAAWMVGDTTNVQNAENPPSSLTAPEYDVWECNGGNSGTSKHGTGCDQGIHEWAGSGGVHLAGYGLYQNFNEFRDVTQPHAYGWLWTPSQVCGYIDNVQTSCHATDATMTDQPVFLILTMGTGCNYQASNTGCIAFNRADVLVSRVTVWQ